jgi:hypothetical protein
LWTCSRFSRNTESGKDISGSLPKKSLPVSSPAGGTGAGQVTDNQFPRHLLRLKSDFRFRSPQDTGWGVPSSSLRVPPIQGSVRRVSRRKVALSLSGHSDFRIWPRISPPGFADVWRLKYHLPSTSSLACSGVTVAIPSMGLGIWHILSTARWQVGSGQHRD